jgi:hypothetical protein
MSWEAFGSGPEPFDVDELYRRGWESDENCEVWWKTEEPEKTFSFDEAIKWYEDLMNYDD